MCCTCDYLSMLGLKLIHVSKKGLLGEYHDSPNVIRDRELAMMDIGIVSRYQNIKKRDANNVDTSQNFLQMPYWFWHLVIILPWCRLAILNDAVLVTINISMIYMKMDMFLVITPIIYLCNPVTITGLEISRSNIICFPVIWCIVLLLNTAFKLNLQQVQRTQKWPMHRFKRFASRHHIQKSIPDFRKEWEG